MWPTHIVLGSVQYIEVRNEVLSEHHIHTYHTMNNLWQEVVIELLKQHRGSVYDLLLDILWSKLNKHSA
jgi:hypothetical protein